MRVASLPQSSTHLPAAMYSGSASYGFSFRVSMFGNEAGRPVDLRNLPTITNCQLDIARPRQREARNRAVRQHAEEPDGGWGLASDPGAGQRRPGAREVGPSTLLGHS